MGRASRRKRVHRVIAESPESTAFREHMKCEQLGEALEMMAIDPNDLDWRSLTAISSLVGMLAFEGGYLPMLRPKRGYAVHEDFDRVICAAGIKKFVRPAMDSDRLGHETAFDPQTGKPDPTIPVPEVIVGSHMLVIELEEGLRIRRGIFPLQGAAP
jgi:hypothetical protein